MSPFHRESTFASHIPLALAATLLAACGSQKPADPHAGHVHASADALWVNGDFETGNLTGWTVDTFLNPGLASGSPVSFSQLGLTAGGSPRTYVRTGTAETVVPAGLPATATLRVPRYGTAVAVVNETGSGRNANRMRQTMTVSTADVDPSDGKAHLRFAIAPVLQNPNHTALEQPYFFIEMNNLTRGQRLFSTFNFANQPGIPWKTETVGGQQVQYTDWQSIDIAPGPASLAVGDQVEIVVVAAGCSQSGHYGHVYIDGLGPVLPGLSVKTTGPAQANSGSTLTYTVEYANDGAGAASNVTVEQTIPAGTTYVPGSASPPSGCTFAAGVLTCNVGTANPASSGTFTFQVTVTAAAGQTINHGNYRIWADSVSPLIGPLLVTTVTSGVTYADLAVTKTDGIAAMAWGGATTYTIAVSNLGPAAANGANLTDPVPANVASQTWTCTGSGGATCASASGSGSPAQAFPAFPVGGQVTLVVNAVASAGSGAGSIVNTATVTAPLGVTDSNQDNNVAIDTTSLGSLRALTLQKGAGAGAGRVQSVPAGIDCAGACTSETASYLDGSQVTLSASADPGSAFAGWSGGGCSGASATCTVTMDAAKTVTATFGLLSWTVTGSATGGGTVSCTSPVLNGQSSTCTISGTGVRLTSLLDNGVNVTASVSGGTYTIASVTGNHTVSGTFVAQVVGAVTNLSGGTQSATVATAYGAQVCVHVADTLGFPVAGQTVTFSVPASGASATLSAPSAVTDASGDACISATAGTVAGAFAVTAQAGPVSGPVATLTNTPGPQVQVEFSVVAGAVQSTPVGTGFGLPLAVVVTDAYGNTVSGVSVGFTLRDPGAPAGATLSASSAVTGANGVAEVTAVANTIAGSYVVDVTVAGVAVPVDFFFSLQNLAGAPATLTVVPGSTPQTGTVGGNAFTNALAVLVQDAFGNPVPGATVSFSAPAAGATAVLSSGTAPTGADGVAQVTATTGNVAGAYVVSASVAGGLSATFSLSNSVGAPGALVLVSGDAQSATVDTAFATALAVRVEDAFGNPVPGVLVAFSAPATGPTALLSTGGLATDAAGQASVTATAGTLAGAFQVTASAAGVAAPVTFDLDSDPGAPASVTTAGGSSPQAAGVGTAFVEPLAVIVRDAFGNPVPGVGVTFDVPGSGATAALSGATATTDASGVASVDATAGLTSGAYGVNASVAGVTTPAAFALTNTAGAPDTIATVSGTPQEAVVDAAYGTPLVVVVRDAHGNAVPGVTVSFAAPASGATATLSSASVQTGADGRAQVTATAGAISGTFQVTASSGGAATPVSFVLTNLPGAAVSATAASASSGQSTRVGEAFASTLVVTVTDVHGNPVPGASVTLACPASGPSCTLASTTATTDAQGRIEVQAAAGTTPGSYQVTATVAGLPAVTFDLTNLVGPPGSIEVVSGGSQTVGVFQPFPAPLVARVKDAFQNVVPAATVTFEVVSTGEPGAVLSAAAADTGSTGEASVSATANFARGSYAVRASAAGVATPATFALENTAIATTLRIDVGLPVFSTVATEGGATRFTVTVGPGANGSPPSGTVTLSSTRPLTAVPGQPGVTQSGAGVTGTLSGGRAVLDVVVESWRSQELTVAYLPDAASAQTWDPVTVSRALHAEEPMQDHHDGGCSTGGGGGIGLLPLLLLALRGRRRSLPAGLTRAARLAVLAIAVLLPGAAGAEFVPGLRLGLAVPGGDLAKTDSMKDTMQDEFSWQIPLQVDLGWKVLPRLVVGGYASYGFARAGDFCTEGATCSARTIDLGVQATWRFALARVSPWVGGGLGWEWASNSIDVEGDVREVRVNGPDVLRVMGGVDWIVGEKWAVGPFAQVAFGRYSSLEVASPLGNSSGKPPDPTLHAWFTLGVRGTFETLVDQAALRKAEADRAAAEEAARARAEADRLAADRAAADAKAEAERLAAAAAAAEAARLAEEAAAKADRDGDGVPDRQDACPDEKGVASDDSSRIGCPELAVVTEKSIDILQQIQFETGKDVLKPESEPILKDVASVLARYPDIQQLRIEGHTDDVGKDAANLALSKRRAESVRRWLVQEGGVAGMRLQAQGYGRTRPIADNATPEGRAKNRRVEFRIVKK